MSSNATSPTQSAARKRFEFSMAAVRRSVAVMLYLLLLLIVLAITARKNAVGYKLDWTPGADWQWQVGAGTVAYMLLVFLYAGGLRIYRRGTLGQAKNFLGAEENPGVVLVASGLRRRARFLNGASYFVLVCILLILWYGYGVFSQAEQRTNEYVLERNEKLIERYTNATATAEGLKLLLVDSTQKQVVVPISTPCELPLPAVDSAVATDLKALGTSPIKSVNRICVQQEFVRQTELAAAYRALANTGAPVTKNGKDTKETKVGDQNLESIALGMTTKLGSVAILFFTIVLLVRLYQYTSRLSVFYHSRADLLHLFKPSDVGALEKFADIYAPDWVEFGKGAEGLYEKLFHQLLPSKVPSLPRFARAKRDGDKAS